MLLRLLCATLCLMPVYAQENMLSPAEKKAGWILLFDGKTWAGWDAHRASDGRASVWQIEDGWISAAGRSPGVRLFGTDLATAASFDDFELTFEWKLPVKGNSGVKYRVQGYLRPRPSAAPPYKRPDYAVVPDYSHAKHDWGINPIGFEYQIYDDDLAAKDPRSATGSLYSIVAPNPLNAVDLGKVHTSRIVTRGKRVEHWLDGVKVVDTDLDAEPVKAELRRNREAAKEITDAELAWDRAELAETLLNARMLPSPIVLQYHGTEVRFRNLKLRRLK